MKKILAAIIATTLFLFSTVLLTPLQAVAEGKLEPPPLVMSESHEIEKMNLYLMKGEAYGLTVARQYLKSEDETVRLYAIEILKNFADLAHIAALEKVASSDQVLIVAEAAEEAKQTILLRETKGKSKLYNLIKKQIKSGNEQTAQLAREKAEELLRSTPEDPEMIELSKEIGLDEAKSSKYCARAGDKFRVKSGGSVTFSCTMQSDAQVDLEIVNLSGLADVPFKEEVKRDKKGEFSYTWKPTPDTPSGLYKVRFVDVEKKDEVSGSFTVFVETQKIKQDSAKYMTTSIALDTDTYEPNNGVNEARSITLGTSYTSYLSVESDEDYYSFSPATNGTVTVDLTVPAALDYDVDVLNSSGKSVGSSINGDGKAEKLTVKVEANSRYFVRVYGYNGDFDAALSYALKVSTVTAFTDSYESNNTMGTAKLMSVGGTYQSYLSHSLDEDYFKFTPSASGLITISFTQPLGAEYYIDFMDSAGNYLYSGYNVLKSEGIEQFSLKVASGKTYYLYIYSYYGVEAAPYTIKLSPITALIDTYEPNDDFATAKQLAFGTSITSYHSWEADADYYKLSPTQDGMLSFMLQVPDPDTFHIIGLLDSSGLPVQEYDLTEDATDRKIDHYTAFLQANQVYYLELRHGTDDPNPQPYTLTIGQLTSDTYEYNSSSDRAYPISLDQMYTSYLSDSYDHDWYSFVSSGAGVVQADVNLPVTTDFQVCIYSNNVKTCQTNQTGQVSVKHSVSSGARVTVLVDGEAVTSSTSPYTLQVTLVGSDPYEPNNTVTDAYSLVYMNRIYSSYLSTADDEDFYKLNFSTSEDMHLTFKGPVDQNYDVVVLDQQQQEIAAGRNGAGELEEVRFHIQAGQTYYLKISGVDGAHSATVPYSLIFSKHQVTYAYDSYNRVKSILFQEGSHITTVNFTFDKNGNLLKIQRAKTELL